MFKFKTDRASAVSLRVSLMQLQISVTTIFCSTLKQMWKKDSKENGITNAPKKVTWVNRVNKFSFFPCFSADCQEELSPLQQVHQSVAPVLMRGSQGRPTTSILGCHWFEPRQELNSLRHQKERKTYLLKLRIKMERFDWVDRKTLAVASDVKI